MMVERAVNTTGPYALTHTAFKCLAYCKQLASRLERAVNGSKGPVILSRRAVNGSQTCGKYYRLYRYRYRYYTDTYTGALLRKCAFPYMKNKKNLSTECIAKTTGVEISANKAMDEQSKCLKSDTCKGKEAESILHNVQIKDSIVGIPDINPANLQYLSVSETSGKFSGGHHATFTRAHASCRRFRDVSVDNIASTKPKKTQTVSNRFRNGFETVNAVNVTFALLLRYRTQSVRLARCQIGTLLATC